MRRKLRRLGRLALLLGLAAYPATLLAQDPEAHGTLKTEKPYLAWGIGVAFLAVTLIVVFKHPHRGHQG